MTEQHKLSNPTEWIDLYGDYLFRYTLLRVRHPHIAEDLLQETLLAALQSRNTYAGHSSERFWLLGILKHKLIDHYRKTSQRELADLPTSDDWNTSFDEKGHWRRDETSPKEWMIDPSTILERKEFWEGVTRCLGELPTRQANAFSLRVIEGHSGKEVCETLAISEANLWVILYRVRMQLRRCLEMMWQDRRNGKRV